MVVLVSIHTDFCFLKFYSNKGKWITMDGTTIKRWTPQQQGKNKKRNIETITITDSRQLFHS